MPLMMTDDTRWPYSSKALVKASSSLNGKNDTLSVSLTGATIFRLSVAATANDVRPWNAFVKAITFFRLLWKDASFSAFSFASAPELQRKSVYASLPDTSQIGRAHV